MSCLSPANNTNHLHWERCEALFLISNPGKADSQLAALEPGRGTGEVHLWKTSRAIPPGSVWSMASSDRGVISSSSRLRPSLGVLPHPAALRVQGQSGGPGCSCLPAPSIARNIWAHTCVWAHTCACAHTLGEVFLEKHHYRQISRKSSFFF